MLDTADGPRALYDARCASGAIRPESAQARAVLRLYQLYRELASRAPAPRGWLGRLVGPAALAPKGLYL